MLAKLNIETLKQKATNVRKTIIEMISEAGSGHTAGSLGMADIFTALYFNEINHNPKIPNWEVRDRVVLSNGHICPVQYATMAHAGYFPVSECLTLRKFGSRLQGHPERHKLPGIETTSGPLGCGLSQAGGMAYALRMDKNPSRVYCLTSDGEHNEGNMWEAALWVAKNKLNNLVQIIDRNRIQISGDTEKVLPLDPFGDKYRAFNWHVIEIVGNNMEEILSAFAKAREVKDKPVVIIANTIPGKGVKEIEGNYKWHGKAPSKDDRDRFLSNLY